MIVLVVLPHESYIWEERSVGWVYGLEDVEFLICPVSAYCGLGFLQVVCRCGCDILDYCRVRFVRCLCRRCKRHGLLTRCVSWVVLLGLPVALWSVNIAWLLVTVLVFGALNVVVKFVG